MLINYLKIAYRNLARHKGFTLINLLGLSIGLCGCLMIALFVLDELQFDKFIPEGEKIYRVYNKSTRPEGVGNIAVVPPVFGPVLQNEFPEVERTLRILNIVDKKLFEVQEIKGYEENGIFAEESFFSFFPLPFENGTSSHALSDPQSVVLTDGLAKKYFGTTNPVGKTIIINKQNLQIKGVLKPIPAHFHLKIDYIIPFSALDFLADRMGSWQWQQFFTYIKLKSNAGIDQLKTKFQSIIIKRAHPITKPIGFTYLPHFQPLRKIHLYSADFVFDIAVRGNAAYVNGLILIAVFVLIIGCFNFINLATARSLRRAREVGVRKVIGAHRSQLLYQFTIESVLLSLISILLASALTLFFLPSLNNLTGKQIIFRPVTDPFVLMTLLLTGIIVGVLAGIYPAMVLSRFKPVKVLKGVSTKADASGKITWLREGFVVVQFALAALLIICTMIVYKQVNFLHTKNLGFNKEELLFFQIRGDNLINNQEAFKAELLRSPNITSVTRGYGFPGDLIAGDDIIVPNQSGNQTFPANQFMVDHDYVKTLGLELVAGRDFSKEMSTDTSEAFLINETAVRELGFGTPEKALGQRLIWNKWFYAPGTDSIKRGRVIGVIKDFHYKSLYEKVTTVVLQLFPAAYYQVAVRFKRDNLEASMDHVKKTWARFAPEYPLDYRFFDESFDAMYKSEDKLSKLLWIFTALAIFVGCMGLFGLATFTAQQRVKEIGIRKVLGASVAAIVGLLSGDFLKLVLIANIIAIPLAWWAMHNWLEDFAYRIHIGWMVFAVAAMAAVLIALVTVSFQAIKAAIANPIKSLRTE